MKLVIYMAKKKNKNKIKFENSSMNDDYQKIIITTVIVLAVLVAFYFITVAILDDSSSKSDNSGKVTEIQYNEILVGTSFSMKESNYLVVYYDTTSDDNTEIATAISTYRSNNKDSKIYYVDMSNALNKKFVSDTGNSSATKADELKINGPTLIRFANDKIVEYVEGVEKIADYLK